MPDLMACRAKFGPSQPFKGSRISDSLHMTIQTAVLIETLTAHEREESEKQWGGRGRGRKREGVRGGKKRKGEGSAEAIQAEAGASARGEGGGGGEKGIRVGKKVISWGFF
ncbi:hypothetical protein AAC387_Pa10g0429 [Persea americana]